TQFGFQRAGPLRSVGRRKKYSKRGNKRSLISYWARQGRNAGSVDRQYRRLRKAGAAPSTDGGATAGYLLVSDQRTKRAAERRKILRLFETSRRIPSPRAGDIRHP